MAVPIRRLKNTKAWNKYIAIGDFGVIPCGRLPGKEHRYSGVAMEVSTSLLCDAYEDLLSTHAKHPFAI